MGERERALQTGDVRIVAAGNFSLIGEVRRVFREGNMAASALRGLIKRAIIFVITAWCVHWERASPDAHSS
jgi:hypothetical protein